MPDDIAVGSRGPEFDRVDDELLATRPVDGTVRAYFAEVLRMVESCRRAAGVPVDDQWPLLQR